MKIAIVSLYDAAFSALTDITFPSLREYCEKWGYATYFGEPFVGLDPRDTYNRFIIPYNLFLQENFDAVMWLDADAMITNHHIRIEDRLGDEKFVIASDLHGLNAGVFIVRNHVETRELFLSLINLGKKLTGEHPFREQEALNRYLAFDHYKHIATVLPQRMMNSVVNAFYQRPPDFSGNWQPGDWILHFPGITLADRCRVAPDFVSQIVR